MSYNFFEKYVIDTNVIVGYILEGFVKKTEKQVEINERFLELQPEQTLIPDFVVTELINLMLKVIPKRYESIFKDKKAFKEIWEKTFAFLKDIEINSTMIFPDEKDIRMCTEKFSCYQKSKPNQKNITFTDFLLITLVQKHSCYILTNEKKLNWYTNEDHLLVKDAISPIDKARMYQSGIVSHLD